MKKRLKNIAAKLCIYYILSVELLFAQHIALLLEDCAHGRGAF
jgi:hypothetical protein